MSERISELISKLEAGPRPAELESLLAKVILEALRLGRKEIAVQLGGIELRIMRDGGTYGPFQEFKTDHELAVIQELTLGLARLLDAPKTVTTRLETTVTSPRAARQMEIYIKSHSLTQTAFAGRAGCSEKTLRNFRKTGKIWRSILADIAQAMGTTLEELLKPE